MFERWKALGPAPEPGTLNVSLADSSHSLEYSIARDSRGKYLFLLDTDLQNGAKPVLPRVVGMSIELETWSNHRTRLVVTLHDDNDAQNFSLMCRGVMLATQSMLSSNSREALTRTLQELHRWQEMLKQRYDKRLSRSERIGLVGELLFLRDELVPRMGLGAALLAWTGHEGHEQDFVISSAIFEVKTQVVTADRMISISSEDQLDPVQGQIFLCNQGISPVPSSASNACTLNSIAKELIKLGEAAGGAASDLLAIGLLEAGYEPHEEYDDEVWMLVDRALYKIRDNFPRIERAELRHGVEQVRYRIRVSDCQPYLVDLRSTLEELIGG
ncbi:PD-(D/E)XK motif protein [Thalassospira sp. HF15]|uniref:PD-(D/E)XK motif protein n=1 Tax=Thalassospira sp. HF15 TaxID=2722755 RepID=UPI0014314626|nr:PD-(D/E)XK motif protein [Thalassospira sp. HF15]NIY74876.1 PD-(D/E)XK motif protein [Thalassospira sp. HF15]